MMLYRARRKNIGLGICAKFGALLHVDKISNYFPCIVVIWNHGGCQSIMGAKHVMFTCARLICGLINLKNHNKVYIFIFVIKLPFQWYKKLQLNICYISSSLIQIIKFPDDIMKNVF
jgi:hypothetical protein